MIYLLCSSDFRYKIVQGEVQVVYLIEEFVSACTHMVLRQSVVRVITVAAVPHRFLTPFTQFNDIK